MNKRTIAVVGAVLIGGVCGAVMAAGGHTVFYHGSVLTHDATTINGRPYVPLADVARVLGGQIASRDGGYEIVAGGGSEARDAAGGANEIKGATGKVGDWFFTGFWRFRVNGVEHADQYTFKYNEQASVDKPKGPNDELVVVNCTIKNGQKSTDSPILTINGLSTQATALTDDQGQSYGPIDFDARGGPMTPGAAKTYAVIFSVPKSAHLHDMIYTVYGFGSSTAKNVRVSLPQ